MIRIRIERLRPQGAGSYDQFLRRHPEALFYHSSKNKEFLKSLLECEEHYLLALDGDRICGALPLLFMESQGKYVYNSLPFYGSNGGIIADNALAYCELAGAYKEIAGRESTISSTIISNPFAQRDSEDLPHNLTDYRIAQFTEIEFAGNHRAEIMSRIDSSARRNVTKATREGVNVKIDDSKLERLREMHQANMNAIGGMAKADQFFSLIPRHFVSGRDFDLYVAEKDGLVIAGLLLLYFNETVEYVTPAIDAEYRTFQPLSLILIEAMTDASRRGFRWWNWGGTWSTQMGVYRFKKKWGAAERHYNYYVQLNDSSILEWSQERILDTFPHFYVAPFSALKKQEQNHGG